MNACRMTDFVDFATAPGHGADERRPAGEVRHVAGEFPTPKDRDGPRCLARFVDDLDLAGPDDEELEVAFADPDEGLPGPVLLEGRPGAMPQRGHLGLVELRGREHRVHRVAPRG